MFKPRNTGLAATGGSFSDVRGTVMVEYTILLCLVSVGCVVAMIGLGAPLVQMYMVQGVWLSLGVP